MVIQGIHTQDHNGDVMKTGKKKCEKIDSAAELQELYAACKGRGLSAEQIIHAACFSQRVQLAGLRNPVRRREHVARCLAILCCKEAGCLRGSALANALGLKCAELRSAVRKAREFIGKENGEVIGDKIRGMRRNVEGGAAECEIEILGREVFGLKRKRERSRLLSRKLCEDIADKVLRLEDEDMLLRGCFVIGRFGGNGGRPNFRKALLEKGMRYLVLLVAKGDGPRDGRIKGILMVADVKKGLSLENFFIEPEFRGHGWGRKMLDALLRKFQEDNECFETLRLEVMAANEAACRLYRAVGFTDGTVTMELEVGKEEEGQSQMQI